MLQPIFFFFQLFVLIPLIVAATGNWLIIPAVFAADFIVQSAIALGASAAAKRWMLLGAMPYFYFLRWVEIAVFVTAFIEVMVLGKFKSEISGWETSDRRYKLSAHALRDTAA